MDNDNKFKPWLPDANKPNYISRKYSQLPPHKKHHPILSTLVIGCVAFISLGMALGRHTYHQARATYQQTYQPEHHFHARNTAKLLQERKPVSILLMGTDTGALGRHEKRGRTDSMILTTVNPANQKISLTSIPRDTRRQNIYKDPNHPDKINNAYTVGGASDAITAVQDLLHIPIDYYAVINMGGLEKMVNAVGGVTVHPQLTFKYGACNVKAGHPVHLNGKQALDYCRMRHQDPKGDYGRQGRQREVIKDLVMKSMQISSLPRYKAILNSLHGNLLTDVTFGDMMTMRMTYAHSTRHLQSDDLSETGEMDNGVSYQVPNRKEINKVHNQIKGNLNG